MLKRLLIAVLVLSLVTAFAGTAFSEIYPQIDGTKLNTHVDNPLITSDAINIVPAQTASRSFLDNAHKLPDGATIPSPPLDYACTDLEYDAGSAYFWYLTEAGDDLFNVRYTSEENFDCTLKTFWVLPYFPALVGTPDMMVYLWDDDGFGFPGTALDSILFTSADMIATGYAWLPFDFAASPNAPVGGWVFSDGAEYHYGVRIIDNSGAGTDAIAILTDDGTAANAGDGRTSFYDNVAGAWGTMLGVYGDDLQMVQSSYNCCGEIPFTDCYTQEYGGGPAYVWSTPSAGGDDVPAKAMRYDVGGPETLVSVDVVIYEADANYSSQDVIVSIVNNDAGLPGATTLFTTTLLAGTYTGGWYINVPVGIVVDQTFHVVVKVVGVPGVSWEYILSDDGTSGTGRSSVFYDDGTVAAWYPTPALYGDDYNWFFSANLCRDQFSDCVTESFNDGIAYLWGVGNAYRDAAAVRMTANGSLCQVNEVTFDLYDLGDPAENAYSQNTKISVYTDAGGVPGTELASVILTPGDYVFFPASQTVDFSGLDVYVAGDYWVVVEALNTYDPLNPYDGIYLLTDDGTGSHSARSAGLFVASGVWETMLDHYGDDYGWLATSSHCCAPFDERTCTPLADAGWSTFQGSQARTGASQLSVGDAWCNLNLNWSFDGPGSVSFTGPVISGDRAVCSFSDRYIVFDIITGAPIYTLDAALGDGQLIGSSVRCAPTIANGVMYISGGSTNGIGAVDFATGALLWQRTIFSVGGSGLFGQTRFSIMTVLNDGTDDVMYFTTDNGAVVAVYAATGALYAGWATNPVYLSGAAYISGATDGTNLFYASQTAATEGDMYSIDAFTGTINWQLTANGGLAAPLEPGYNYPEGFRGGVAYQNGVLYAVSWANDGGASDYPLDGFFYSVDAGSGNHVVPPVKTNRAIYSTPVVDQNAVYAPTLSQWANPTDPTEGNLIAFSKATGTQLWGAKTADDANYYSTGILSCEPDGVDDLLFIFNSNGFFECYNSKSGEQVFRRRVDHGGGSGEIGFAGAMAMTATDDLHMLFADFYGGLYDFKLGADRPRMEIQTYQPFVPVEFGANPALAVNVGPIMVNTGCADLNIASSQVDEATITGASLPAFAASYVSDDIMERANAIADNMQRDAFLSKFRQIDNNLFDTNEDILNVKSLENNKSVSRFAAGIPAWFVSLDQPIAGSIIPAGDTMDLLITVNQPLINRGPQSVYIAWDSDDPDFFLNAAADAAGLLPEIKLTVVGGCLIDYTELNFGVGAANLQLVTNTGRLGTGDWSPHGFDIDGVDAAYYQGSMIYGNSTYALALNTQDWSSGGGEADAWTSMQADPNYCDSQCKPALTAGVAVGAITVDGITYDPINADMVCKTYLDSVENFDTDPDPLVTTWDWSDFSVKSFDDTLTMGLMANTRTIGVIDLPELANLTLEIMNFTERNGNNVDDWYLGQITDYDVGGDMTAWDQSISAAWAYDPGGDAAFGSIKIPFGCGTVGAGQDFDYASIRGAKGLDGATALFDINAYFDSAYIYLSTPGLLAQQPFSADGEMHTSYAGHNFGPNGTYSVGVANFFVQGLADNTSGAELADMANLVNKWAGFGRGDVNNDGGINLADIIYLASTVNNAGPGAIPFAHLSDVNADGTIDAGDINYLVDYYFNCGPCPMGDWMF